MGQDGFPANPGDGEGPSRSVATPPFSIGATAVSSQQFARFVEATDHQTDAERFGWSYVFEGLLPDSLKQASPSLPAAPWWRRVEGADWQHPLGPQSRAEDDHPVVHVSWADAARCAAWMGGRLPAEIEWEYAARGGLAHKIYPWGDEFQPDGKTMTNIWEGSFPTLNTVADGYLGTAPVDAFPPNGFGLYNMVGNVWEWCTDPWSAEVTDMRVVRGGSYLCHDSYCNRYRVSARTAATADSSTGNTGFRVAGD